jgi:hypothetical protein
VAAAGVGGPPGPTSPSAAQGSGGSKTPLVIGLAVVAAIVLVGVIVVVGKGGSDDPEPMDTAAIDLPASSDGGGDVQDPDVSDGSDVYEDTTVTEAPTTTTTEQVTTTLPPLEAARAGLAETRSADQAEVDAILESWVPQVSSKYVGLVADGITYDEISILQNHRNLAERYSPDRVALIYSSDYSTFKNPDFWVSIALVPYPTPEGANGWCDQMGIPPDHCFAKLISHTASHVGATLNRK